MTSSYSIGHKFMSYEVIYLFHILKNRSAKKISNNNVNKNKKKMKVQIKYFMLE